MRDFKNYIQEDIHLELDQKINNIFEIRKMLNNYIQLLTTINELEFLSNIFSDIKTG